MLISNLEKQEITNLIFNKKFEEAQNQVNQLIKKYPKEYILFNFLGAIFAEQNNLIQAIEYYEKSIKLNSKYAEAYSNLGSLFEKSGQYEKAEENLNIALKLNPNLVAAYNNLGTVFKEQNRFEEAIDTFKKAIKLNPNNPSIYNKIGYLQNKIQKLEESVSSHQEAFIKRTGINFDSDKELRPATTDFFLEITNKCNFHCEFCPSDLQKRSSGFMDFSLIKKILDEIEQKKIVNKIHLHLMGEPTLHPKLNEILNYAKNKKISVDLITNGSTLVSKKIPGLLNSISGKLVASFMTPTQDTYKVRGNVGLTWDRYKNNYQLLVQEHLNKISRNDKIEYEILMRIMVTGKNTRGAVNVLETADDVELNWNEWNKFVSDLEKKYHLIPFERPKIDSKYVLSLVTDSRSAIFKLQKGLKIEFWKAFTFANSRLNEDYKLQYQQETSYCPHPFTDFGVLWNGDVNLCCLDHDGTLKVGNLKNDSIENVINNVAAQKLRGSMLSRGKLHPTCQKCQANPINSKQ